jgi:hemolysin activation/secretion protein
MKMKRIFNYPLSALALVIASLPAFAAEAPDAGRTLQETKPVLELPSASPSLNIEAQAPGEALPGGASVTLQSVVISGNSLYDEAALKAVLGDVVGKTYDLAGLKGLANQLTAHYRNHGYPFARAFVPAQPMSNGALKIEVVEGKYGQASATGDESLTQRAQGYLVPLQAGEVIESKKLERATLILDDLPGIKTTPIIRPGQEVGTGDLDVKVERDNRLGGEVGVDNYGNRYTGRNRARASVHVDSPFTLGDQITASGLYTEEDMWLGSVGYSLPIGNGGLRASVGYSHTYYELGKDFANLDAQGTAKITSAGLSYPIIRSQKANLSVSGIYQYKDLNDQQDVANISDSKSSDSLPIALNFDLRDGLGGCGITYGNASWTHGNLNLDSTLEAADRVTARTNGSFDKFNLDLARLQALPANFTLFGRVSAQWASDNLDSSEGFGLGGANGVRAYPSGEGYGDEGWLAQAELRYTATLKNTATINPYAFYDSGRVRINHNTWDNAENHRSISGAGLGVRTGYKGFSADASVAWRMYGGNPQSDTKDYTPMAWVNAGYKF